MAIFDDKVQGIGAVEALPLTRKKLALESHSYECDKCGPIKDILIPREPVSVIQKM